jgi:hypothetical protein
LRLQQFRLQQFMPRWHWLFFKKQHAVCLWDADRRYL